MRVKSKIIVFMLSVFIFFSPLYSQTYKEDSLAVRAILDSNDMDWLPVEQVSTQENGRIVVLYLEADMVINIKYLPSDISKLTALRNLTLIKFPYFTTLPPEIGDLKALDSLIIQECGLTELPEEIGGCSSLKFLNVNQNDLGSLPATIGNLSSLKTLIVFWNNIVELPPEIGNLDSLSILYCNVNEITSLPSEIGNLSSLIKLSIQRNNLNALPPEIGNLTSLQELYAGDNPLTELPSEIGNLNSLKICWVDNIGLTEMIPEIGDLLKLEELVVKQNKLKTLPSEFSNLTSLKKGNFSYNSLETLPNSITSLNLPQGPSGINLCFNPDLVFTEGQQVWAGAADYVEYEGKYCDTEIEETFSKATKSLTALLSFSPNSVRYTVPNPGHLRLEVFSVKGEKLKTLFNGYMSAGAYTVSWRAEQAGIYLIKLKVGTMTVVKKNIIVQ